MQHPDVRWKQRLNSFSRGLEQLEFAVRLSNERTLTDLEKQGMIQAFEFTHELGWNVMRDYFIDQGASLISGSKDATKEAFQKGLIENGQEWMEMIKSRNLSSHTYNQKVANDIVDKIQKNYFVLFQSFYKKMLELSKK